MRSPTAVTIGIMVLYKPPSEALTTARLLAESGLPIVLVYNESTAQQRDSIAGATGARVVGFSDNRGLAHALNRGIAEARDMGGDYVFLLDQDSAPDQDMVSKLLHTFTDAERGGFRVAIVGPTPVDVKVAGKAGHEAHRAGNVLKWKEVTTVITSGSVISLDALDAIGPMWEDLFIDHIDHEWCLRAKQLGWSVLQLTNKYMAHDLGDAGINVLGRFKGLHRSPFRHYHILRNTLAMVRIRRIPLRWRVTEALKTFYRVPIYLATSVDRPATLRALLRAVRDHVETYRSRPQIWR